MKTGKSKIQLTESRLTGKSVHKNCEPRTEPQLTDFYLTEFYGSVKMWTVTEEKFG